MNISKSREARLAALVADGMKVAEAGAVMGMTKGQTARVWTNVKRQLGLIDYK
jgi:hypothetical protein